MVTVSLKDLLEAGCHFGHQSRRGNPKMRKYLYGARDGIHVFDLVKTKEGLEKATAFAHDLVAKGGVIVFVGTKRQAQEIIKEEAKKAGVPYVSVRWLGGTITNWEQMKKRIDLMVEMKEKREKGEYKKYTKKEQLLIDREIAKLEQFLGGLESLKKIPDALFVIDIKKEITAVLEARRKGIPIVAVVDSNCDPDLVDWAIPANDDAVGSIKLLAEFVAAGVREGKQMWDKKAAKEEKEAKKAEKSK